MSLLRPANIKYWKVKITLDMVNIDDEKYGKYNIFGKHDEIMTFKLNRNMILKF